jgi:hypothetical protein
MPAGDSASRRPNCLLLRLPARGDARVRARCNDLPIFAVRRLQGGSHEFRGDAAITHGLRHLGMLDDHRAARQAVLQQDAVTLDLRREFMPISVMTNLQFHMPSPPLCR